VVKACCGSMHTVLLTGKGNVYSCGMNVFGQLGQGKLMQFEETMNNQTSSFIVDVACGYDHTLMISNDGSVFSCGCNDKGQLALNHSNHVEVPRRVNI
ncbi:hypothetical protein GUITHDRAFT_52564, partial [Guillardia theta CCMP2712]